MMDGAVFQQEWVWIGLTAFALVAACWLLKTLLKWLLILVIIGFCIWHFWLA